MKTRIGYATNELDTWLPTLLEEKPSVVTLHARTRNEMSLVPAHWETISQAVAIRDAMGSQTLILGNGDVADLAEAHARVAETGCDGVMLGRAIYGNPWLFADANNPERSRGTEITPTEKVRALMEHLQLFDELLGDTTHFAVMKKHFKAYISGWPAAKMLRIRLMETQTVHEALVILSTVCML